MKYQDTVILRGDIKNVTKLQIVFKVVIKKEHNIEMLSTSEVIPIINENEQLKIIETHPLHPKCKWYPPSSNAIDKRNLFVCNIN